MSRDLLDRMSSSSLLVVQLTASVLALGLLSLREVSWRRIDARLMRASLTGILEPGLAYAVGLAGLAYTTAGNASVIGATEPILIVLLVWLFLGQRPSKRLLGCIGVAMTGLLLVSSATLATVGPAHAMGDGLIVAATLFAAAYVVASSRLVQDFPAATLAAAQQSVGLVVALALHAAGIVTDLGTRPAAAMTAPTLVYAAASGVVQYAMAFWLYLVGLRYLAPSVAALWLTLIPVFGLTGSMTYLGERPSLLEFIGAALIIVAVLAAQRER